MHIMLLQFFDEKKNEDYMKNRQRSPSRADQNFNIHIYIHMKKEQSCLFFWILNVILKFKIRIQFEYVKTNQ